MAHRLTSDLRTQVPSGTYKQRRNGVDNIYVYTQCHPDLPNPKNVRQIHIGKLDEDGYLIPNQNYENYFHEKNYFNAPLKLTIDPNNDIGPTISVGFKILADHLIETSGLKDCLYESFGVVLSEYIIQISYYLIAKGKGTVSAIKSYCKNHLGAKLTSQKCSDIFALVEGKEKGLFYKKWASCAIDKTKNDIIAFDVTSVSSYSKTNPDVEPGYNRDKEKLPQINIGLMTNIATGIPIYIDSYAGSITDADNLKELTTIASKYGVDEFCLVMDGGFFDKDRIEYLNESNFKYIIGMPGYLKQSKDIIDRNKDVNDYKNKMRYYGVYAMEDKEKATIFNTTGKAIILYDTLRRELENHSSYTVVAKLKNKLENKVVKKYSKIIKMKKYTTYFDFKQIPNDIGYTYEYNEDKAVEANKRNGYSVIFTNREDITVSQVVDAYRMKDEDEKSFFDFKNSLNGYRLHTHGKATAEGKVFVMFIALCILRIIRKTTREYRKREDMCLPELIDKLEALTCTNIKNKFYISEKTSKTYRELYESVGIDLDKEIKKITE